MGGLRIKHDFRPILSEFNRPDKLGIAVVRNAVEQVQGIVNAGR